MVSVEDLVVWHLSGESVHCETGSQSRMDQAPCLVTTPSLFLDLLLDLPDSSKQLRGNLSTPDLAQLCVRGSCHLDTAST